MQTKEAAVATTKEFSEAAVYPDSSPDAVSDIEKKSDDHVHNSSNAETLYHIICVVAGTGILQIPYSLRQSGWLGCAGLIFSAFVNYYTGRLLILCLYQKSQRSPGGFPEIGRLAFGRWGEYVVQFFYCIVLIGSTCLYLVLAGQSFADIIGVFNMQLWILICFVAVLIPIIALRTLKEVAIVSLFGAFASVLMAVIVWVLGMMRIAEGVEDVSYKFIDISKFPIAFATFSFSYSGNFVYPEVEQSMATPEAFPKVLSLSLLIITVLYVATGAIGYGAYGGITQSPITDSLMKGPATTSAVLVITAHVLLACPLLIASLSNGLERRLQIDAPKDTPRQWTLRTLLRVGIMGIVITVAYLVPDFKGLMNILGSVANTALIYIFPIVFYYKIHGISGRSFIELGTAVFVLAIGILCGVVGGIESVEKLINPDQE